MITLALMLKRVGFRTTNNIQGGNPSYNIADKLYVLKWKSDPLMHKISELLKCSLYSYKSHISTADSVIKGLNITELNIQSMTTYALLNCLCHAEECVFHLDFLHFLKELDPFGKPILLTYALQLLYGGFSVVGLFVFGSCVIQRQCHTGVQISSP
jgi:hypothetical protein